MEHKHTPGEWLVNGGDDVWIGNRICVHIGDEDDARLIAAAPELLAELQHAHQIILNAVAVMTSEQLSAWAQANERDGCDGDGATRYHERAEVIARATWSKA